MIQLDSPMVRPAWSWAQTARLAILLVAAGIAGYAINFLNKA